MKTWINIIFVLVPTMLLVNNVANDPMATLMIVFPVRMDTNNFLGWESSSFSFNGISSLCNFKLKYAVSVPEKNADKIRRSININMINEIVMN